MWIHLMLILIWEAVIKKYVSNKFLSKIKQIRNLQCFNALSYYQKYENLFDLFDSITMKIDLRNFD